MPDSCIFVDDGISGAEFAIRPGFVRLMAVLKPRPPFRVLIMSEDDFASSATTLWSVLLRA